MQKPLFRTKICGIRSEDDYNVVIEQEPDAIGFIIGARHYTEDEVDIPFVKEMVKDLKKRDIPTVGVIVTHLQKAKEIMKVVNEVDLRIVQIHDEIPIMELVNLRVSMPDLTLIKAIHVNRNSCVSKIMYYSPYVDAICLDTAHENRIGGTGIPHDWNKSKILVNAFPDIRFILAGGLNPDNVVKAIKKVCPYAVDVNSGVEVNGNKDREKVSAFLKKARKYLLKEERKCLYC